MKGGWGDWGKEHGKQEAGALDMDESSVDTKDGRKTPSGDGLSQSQAAQFHKCS